MTQDTAKTHHVQDNPESLSIIVPVYNETPMLPAVWEMLEGAPIQSCIGITRVEIIFIDDGSTDGSYAILKELIQKGLVFKNGMAARLTCLRNSENRGKGYSIRRGIDASTGDVVLIQDADLEYSPDDYPQLIAPIVQGNAQCVFGSRYIGYERQVLPFWHSLMNRMLTLFSNMMCNIDLTDMETCYKVFLGEYVRRFRLTSNRFGIEPELASRVANAGLRIYEVPIRYKGRTYAEGKKIRAKDGLEALISIVRFGVFDTTPFKTDAS